MVTKRQRKKKKLNLNSRMLNKLKRDTFKFFVEATSYKHGLMPDCTRPGSPASIAVMGLGLTCLIVGVEDRLISRKKALAKTLRILRFFWSSEQSRKKNATGYKGFYYHFLDMNTGRRAWRSEISTIDTAILMAGILTVAQYFTKESPLEQEVRQLARDLYLRVDWNWALNSGKTISHGWKPGSGFLPYQWSESYNEAHILYILALGSPTFSIKPEIYLNFISGFKTKTFYKQKYIYAGPLFIHQMSQIWLDFRGLRDSVNQKLGFDYFENSRRATVAQQKYGIDNPHKYKHYGKNSWGITASDGPGPARKKLEGRDRIFYGYEARGAPDDIDDGTISPWAVVTSLPFSPQIVLNTTRHAIERLKQMGTDGEAGFDASYNATFPGNKKGRTGWISPWRFGLNQGPVILMIDNYQNGSIWKLFKKCEYVVEGLNKAGFKKVRRRESF